MVELSGELTIYEVEKLKDLFLQELKADAPLILDMAKIEKIDMVGIQLLLSLMKTAQAQDKKMELTNISQGVLQQIKICHCEKALGIVNA